jgi:hypothetical protein
MRSAHASRCRSVTRVRAHACREEKCEPRTPHDALTSVNRAREQRQAQLDVGGVQREGGPLQLGAERLSCIELARLRNQRLRERRIEAPIAPFVGFGPRRAGDAQQVLRICSRDICRYGVVSVGGCGPPFWLSDQARDNATSDSHQSWDGTPMIPIESLQKLPRRENFRWGIDFESRGGERCLGSSSPICRVPAQQIRHSGDSASSQTR